MTHFGVYALAACTALAPSMACRGPRIAESSQPMGDKGGPVGRAHDASPALDAASSKECQRIEGRRNWYLVSWTERARRELAGAAQRGVLLVRATSCDLRVVSILGVPYERKAIADCEAKEHACPGPIEGCARFPLVARDEIDTNLAPPGASPDTPLHVRLRPSVELSYAGPVASPGGATHVARRIVSGTATSNGAEVADGPLAIDLAPLDGAASPVDCGLFVDWNGLYCAAGCFHGDLAQCLARCDRGQGASCTHAAARSMRRHERGSFAGRRPRGSGSRVWPTRRPTRRAWLVRRASHPRAQNSR